MNIMYLQNIGILSTIIYQNNSKASKEARVIYKCDMLSKNFLPIFMEYSMNFWIQPKKKPFLNFQFLFIFAFHKYLWNILLNNLFAASFIIIICIEIYLCIKINYQLSEEKKEAKTFSYSCSSFFGALKMKIFKTN